MAKPKAQLEQEQVERIAHAVSDPRRFEMLRAIAAESRMTCTCLRESQPVSPATISHHLKELSEAGLVELQRDGRTMDIAFRRDVWDAYLATLSSL